MSTNQEFSIKGPIFKLALKHGEEATRHVDGKKPKTIEMAAVARLVAEGVSVWARFTPKRWVQKEGESDRWMAGAQDLDPIKAKLQFMAVAEEVLMLFTQRPGVKVRISIEIEAEAAGGFGDGVQRSVRENCNQLKFKNHEFGE